MQDWTLDSSYLETGEYVVWKGKPEKGRGMDPQAMITVPFGIVWTIFSLIFLWVAYEGKAPIIVWVISLLFLFIGLCFTFGGFIRRAATRGKIQYYVTNDRLIVVEGENVSFYTADDLPPMQVRRHKNGCGSIIFCERYDCSYRGGRRYTIHTVCMLENIKDVAGAQRALSEMLRQEADRM